MPYLNEHDRKFVEHVVTQITMADIDTPGKLNYLITTLIVQAMKNKAVNYTLLNGIYGAVTLAAQEFWVRVIQPYEMDKRIDNGDIHGYDSWD